MSHIRLKEEGEQISLERRVRVVSKSSSPRELQLMLLWSIRTGGHHRFTSWRVLSVALGKIYQTSCSLSFRFFCFNFHLVHHHHTKTNCRFRAEQVANLWLSDFAAARKQASPPTSSFTWPWQRRVEEGTTKEAIKKLIYAFGYFVFLCTAGRFYTSLDRSFIVCRIV